MTEIFQLEARTVPQGSVLSPLEGEHFLRGAVNSGAIDKIHAPQEVPLGYNKKLEDFSHQGRVP